jgi:hypothetical protein
MRGLDLVLVSDVHTASYTPADGAARLSGVALRSLINARTATLRYPGRTIEVQPAAEIVFGERL